MSYRILIPARYDSTRLPGKPLKLIAGKPLLQYVYQQASQAAAASVTVATDDERIVAACKVFGADVVMTARDHASGSDRIAEVADIRGWQDQEVLVNLQGDEPLMPPACLDQVARLLSEHADIPVASLWWPITSDEEFGDPSAVKVVTDHNGLALYFSRAPIPYSHQTGEDQLGARRHVGLYAYRAGGLRRISRLPASSLENRERLEQLRWMEAGERVILAKAVAEIPPGVDTEEDLERVRQLL